MSYWGLAFFSTVVLLAVLGGALLIEVRFFRMPWSETAPVMAWLGLVLWLSMMAFLAVGFWNLPPWLFFVALFLIIGGSVIPAVYRGRRPPPFQLYTTEHSPIARTLARWFPAHWYHAIRCTAADVEYSFEYVPDRYLGFVYHHGISLGYCWKNHLLLWIGGSIIIVRDIREVRKQSRGETLSISADCVRILGQPWEKEFYGGIYCRENRNRLTRIVWDSDQIEYRKFQQELHREDFFVLQDKAEPAWSSDPLDYRFLPADDTWWREHLDGKTFLVRVGRRVLGTPDLSLDGPGRPLRFTVLFQYRGSWVTVTDRDDVLVISGITDVSSTPEGRLILSHRDRLTPWICFDTGGSEWWTELYIKEKDRFRWFQADRQGVKYPDRYRSGDERLVVFEPVKTA